MKPTPLTGFFRRALFALFVLAVVAVPVGVAAQPAAPATPPAAEKPEGEDLIGPETPRGAVKEYLDACRAGQFDRAASFLDLSWLSSDERDSRAPILARHFKVVLDQKLWIDLDELSARVEGHDDDGLREGVDRVGFLKTGQGDVDILVKRVTDEQGGQVWKFSRSTTRRIPDLYDEFGYGALGELLPAWMFGGRFLEIEIWQWLGLLVIALAAYVVGVIVVAIVTRIVRPIAARTQSTLDDELLRLTVTPARLIVALAAFAVGSLFLRLSVPARETLSGLEKGLAILLVTWVFLKCINLIEDVIRQRLIEEGKTSMIAALPLARRSFKVALLLLAGIAMLQNLGFNVTGVLAGLGVGGLAVALAAQKTIENLFGGVAVTVDQPVRVGDFCKYGDKIGTVEDIGLRSTRIRSLDRTVVTVPNSEFSQIQVENYAKRDRMRIIVMLGLRYETTSDQLRHVLKGLRELLIGHPRVLDDPCRVRFVGFGAYSLDLEVFAYVDTQDYNEFLAIREDIYLRMIDVIDASGTGFAFPSQTLYLGRDGGLDAERSRAAEADVRKWRESGRLPFPGFDAETMNATRGTLDYPPKGSVLAGTAGPTT